MHSEIRVIVAVDNIVVLVYITVEFSMVRELTAKQDKYTFESLDDVCEFMLHLCSNKSVHKETPLMMAASSGTRVDCESFWGDERRGS